MFNFCLRPDTGRSDKERAMIVARRKYQLNYLRLAVASWARPEAILAVRRDQWTSEAAVLDLNPARRLRTNKRQPRTEERSGGKEWVSTCRYRGAPDN